MSLRLGPRCLSPELLAEQRTKGIGTEAAQFRLGPRVLKRSYEPPAAEAAPVVEAAVPALEPVEDEEQEAEMEVQAPKRRTARTPRAPAEA